MSDAVKLEASQVLESWDNLCNVLGSIRDEHYCKLLLDVELAGKRRGMFLFRIHSRYNRLRANRERLELMKLIGGDPLKKISSYPLMVAAMRDEAENEHRAA